MRRNTIKTFFVQVDDLNSSVSIFNVDLFSQLNFFITCSRKVSEYIQDLMCQQISPPMKGRIKGLALGFDNLLILSCGPCQTW